MAHYPWDMPDVEFMDRDDIHTLIYICTVRALYKDNPIFSKGPFCPRLF